MKKRLHDLFDEDHNIYLLQGQKQNGGLGIPTAVFSPQTRLSYFTVYKLSIPHP